jgi:lipoic acid synthetase
MVTQKTCSLTITDCGLTSFRDILQLQYELLEKRRKGLIPNTVLIVEHYPVITLGARESANKLKISQDHLKRKNIDLVKIRRGGGVTAHNPGQLVFYPILNLHEMGLGISEYIRLLETISEEFLKQLGVKTQRRKGFPGLWINDKKIASIGVRVSKGVTYHGMAINIQNDLSIFDLITPCGLDDIEITSVLKETSRQYPMEQVKKKLSEILMKYFSYKHTKHNAIRNTQYEPRAKGPEARKLPDWLRRPLPASQTFSEVEKVLNSLHLETICSHANCPNRGECWSRGTATVLILGNICTRNCRFCSVKTGRPTMPDTKVLGTPYGEPERLADMAKRLGLKYLVITSVNRDDLPDGGASHFRDCINYVRKICPDVKFEILTPDFRNCQVEALDILKDALPFVFAHNVETVPSLYRLARAGGDYRRSLNLLQKAKEILFNVQTKSSIMLGLGETDNEIEQVLKDLREVGCDRITIGQYLKPSKKSLEVVRYIPPDKFDFWRNKAIESGFSWVISSPFARSSYFAEKEDSPF